MKIKPVALLILVNLLAVCALAWMWLDQNANIRNVQWQAPTPIVPHIEKVNAPSQPATAAPNPILYIAILERPVFAPDRRPPPPPAPPAEPPPPDPMANVQLMGLFSGENGGVLARVEGKVRRIRVNDMIGAWTLKSVEAREASFAQGEEIRKLVLAYSKFGSAVVPVAASLPPAAGAPSSIGTPLPASTAHLAPNVQDEMRARLIRRNEVRARAGLPPATE